MKPADHELRVALTKLSDVAFELDGLSMPARDRLRLAQKLRHAQEAAERAVRFAREERGQS